MQEQNHSDNEYQLSEILDWYIKHRTGSEIQYEKTRLFAAQVHKTKLECEFTPGVDSDK